MVMPEDETEVIDGGVVSDGVVTDIEEDVADSLPEVS